MDTTHALLADRENPENWEREYRENPDGFKDALQEIEKTHGNLVLVRAWKARLMDVVVSKFPRSFWYVMVATVIVYGGVLYFDRMMGKISEFPLMMWIVPFLLHYVWLHRKQVLRAPYVAVGVVLVGVAMYLWPTSLVEADRWHVLSKLSTFRFILGLSGLGLFFVYVGKRHIDTYIDTITRLFSWALLTTALYASMAILMFSYASSGFSFDGFDLYGLAVINGLAPFVAYYILDRSQNWLKIGKLYAKLFTIPLAVIALGVFFRAVYLLLSGSLGFSFTTSFFGVGFVLLALLFATSLIMKQTNNNFHFARFESLFFGLVSGVLMVLSICAVVLFVEGGSAFWTEPYFGANIDVDSVYQVYWWGLIALSTAMSVHAGLFSQAAVQRQLGKTPSYNLPMYWFLVYPMVSIGAIIALIWLT